MHLATPEEATVDFSTDTRAHKIRQGDQLQADLAGLVSASDLHQSCGSTALLPKAMAVLTHI